MLIEATALRWNYTLWIQIDAHSLPIVMERSRRRAFVAATALMFDATDDDNISLADVLDDATENTPASESESDNFNGEHQDGDEVLDEDVLVALEDNEEYVENHNEEFSQSYTFPSGERSRSNQPNIGRQPRRNILRVEPGISRGVNPSSALECFLMYIGDSLSDILRCTNLHGRRITQQYNQHRER